MVNWTIQQWWGCLGGRGGVSMRGHWWLITEMVEAGSNRLVREYQSQAICPQKLRSLRFPCFYFPSYLYMD